MPPVRSSSTAAGNVVKPTKTERTHEENQERAYIAASRRSDRSLEARIESARRASEIHKKRTGRALKVTEQDVLNEEMYEEEDDDLPAQFRRLQAHINGAFPFTNHRFESYMMSNLAMRSAMYANAYGSGQQQPQYVNPPTFSHNFSPQQMAAAYSQPSNAPSAPSPTTNGHRTNPYPPHSYRPGPHARSASIAGPPSAVNNSGISATPTLSITEEQRRMSLPVSTLQADSPSSASVSSLQRPSLSRTDSSSGTTSGHPTPDLKVPADSMQMLPNLVQPVFTGFPPGTLMPVAPQNFGGNEGYSAINDRQGDPLSPRLPLNQQQILNPSTTVQNMYGNQLYSYPGMEDKSQFMSMHAGMTVNSGMNQTLSTNPLGVSMASGMMMPAFTMPGSASVTPGLDMNGDGWLNAHGHYDFNDLHLFGGGIALDNTGEECNFASFVNDE